MFCVLYVDLVVEDSQYTVVVLTVVLYQTLLHGTVQVTVHGIVYCSYIFPVRLATWSFMHIVQCWHVQVLTCLNSSRQMMKIRGANVKI